MEAFKSMEPIDVEKYPTRILDSPTEVQAFVKRGVKRGIFTKIGDVFKQAGHTVKGVFTGKKMSAEQTLYFTTSQVLDEVVELISNFDSDHPKDRLDQAKNIASMVGKAGRASLIGVAKSLAGQLKDAVISGFTSGAIPAITAAALSTVALPCTLR